MRLSQETTAELAHAARKVGVPLGVALTVLVEAELAIEAVTDAGATISLIGTYDDRESQLSQAQADYVDVLCQRAPVESWSQSAAGLAAVPVRLLSFCDEPRLRLAVRRDLDQVLRWEMEAVRAGRTLTEWVLRQALMTAGAVEGC